MFDRNPDFNSYIGNLIKQMRLDRGYTQKQLGKAIGIGDSTISKYEHGTRVPDLEMFIAIVEACGQCLYIDHC